MKYGKMDDRKEPRIGDPCCQWWLGQESGWENLRDQAIHYTNAFRPISTSFKNCFAWDCSGKNKQRRTFKKAIVYDNAQPDAASEPEKLIKQFWWEQFS